MDDGLVFFRSGGGRESYVAVPGTYFKLDPERGRPGADPNAPPASWRIRQLLPL